MTRKEAIEFLKNMIDRESIGFVCPKGDGDVAVWEYHVTALNMAIKALAQPEPCEDAVSRKDVVKFLDDWTSALNANCHHQSMADLKIIKNDFENLPSAQPEHNPDDERKIADLHKMVNHLLSRPEQQWIPCSERLPEEYGNYLITTHDGNVDIGTIDPKKKGVWSACDSDGFYWLREVIAWMPLPEPYREEGGE